MTDTARRPGHGRRPPPSQRPAGPGVVLPHRPPDGHPSRQRRGPWPALGALRALPAADRAALRLPAGARRRPRRTRHDVVAVGPGRRPAGPDDRRRRPPAGSAITRSGWSGRSGYAPTPARPGCPPRGTRRCARCWTPRPASPAASRTPSWPTASPGSPRHAPWTASWSPAATTRPARWSATCGGSCSGTASGTSPRASRTCATTCRTSSTPSRPAPRRAWPAIGSRPRWGRWSAPSWTPTRCPGCSPTTGHASPCPTPAARGSGDCSTCSPRSASCPAATRAPTRPPSCTTSSTPTCRRRWPPTASGSPPRPSSPRPW